MHKFICPESDQSWKDLDGTNVEFRSAFRPRARYLYFNYCIQILRRAWKAERSAAEQMRQEFNAGFWGTRGPYLPRSMLRAFVEELGHGYEELSAGARDNGEGLLIAVASRQVTVHLMACTSWACTPRACTSWACTSWVCTSWACIS